MFFQNNIQAQQLTGSYTTSNFNGYSISCNGANNGSITVTITDGTAPYFYKMANQESGPVNDMSFTFTNLSAAEYQFVVYDVNGLKYTEQVALREPPILRVETTLNTYPNGFNTSCFFCQDGTVTLNVSGGVGNYTYMWSDGITIANRSNLAAKSYSVTVKDGNQCIPPESNINLALTAPERDDWTANGNSNANANSFIGTTTNYDFVMKANNSEALRLKTNGDALFSGNKIQLGSQGLSITNQVTNGINNLVIGSEIPLNLEPSGSTCNQGSLLNASSSNFQNGFGIYNIKSSNPATVRHRLVFNLRNYNAYMELQGDNIGTNAINPPELFMNYGCGRNINICTGNLGGLLTVGNGTTGKERFLVNGNSYFNGIVSIGTSPQNVSGNYKLVVDGKIGAREFKVTAAINWPDYVFEKEYSLFTFDELADYIKKNKHLPRMPSAKEVSNNEGFDMAQTQALTLEKLEELYLYVLQQQKEIETLKLQLNTSKQGN
jgi:hypothetical protein